MTEKDETAKNSNAVVPSNGDDGDDGGGSCTGSIPTVNMEDPDAAKQLSIICRDVGFFYLEGHGFTPEEIDRVFEESKKMFALPIEEKKKLSDKRMSRGYKAMQVEILDRATQKEGDTKEGYYIGWDIPKDDPMDNLATLRGAHQWPDRSSSPNFQSIMEDYQTKITNLALQVVRLISLSLELEESHFDDDFKEDESIATLGLLHYSKRKSNPLEGIYACGAHSDYGMATLLLTDEHPGLQIHHKGEWIDVPPRPYSFVVNIGDMLEIWTNGLYKSTVHRVLTTSSDYERYSIPFFFDPAYETVVKCLESCTDENNPPKYPPTTAGQHLVSKFKGTHADFSPAAAAAAADKEY